MNPCFKRSFEILRRVSLRITYASDTTNGEKVWNYSSCGDKDENYTGELRQSLSKRETEKKAESASVSKWTKTKQV